MSKLCVISMMKHVMARVSAVVICAFVVSGTNAGERDSRARPAGIDAIADRAVVHTIFREADLRSNTLAVHEKARSLPENERYDFLCGWVLPDGNHRTYRVTGEFGSADPPPMDPLDRASASSLTPGVAVLSPAVELIEVSRQLERLDDLRSRVHAGTVPRADLQQKYLKAVLLFLIEVAKDDPDAATAAFDQVIEAAMKIESDSAEVRWPALLLLRAVMAGSDEGIRRHVTEFFFSRYGDLSDYTPDTKLDVLNDHLRSLFSLDRFRQVSSGRPVTVSEQWIPFVYSDSETRGNGRPAARWHFEQGEVQKLTGHEMDYLGFRSPLYGNYEVECDFTSAHGEHSSFMVAGSAVQAVEDGASIRISSFRKPHTDILRDVPLTKQQSTVRYRAVVRDGVLQHFLNGEEVHHQRLPPEHNPWVAIRAWRRSLGRVSDFRITGSPVVPDRINLTGDPELSGWAPYFESGFGRGSGNWSATGDGSGGTLISGQKRPEFAGSSVQKLLRYCRPVIEDGTIEYEFFYIEDAVAVYPALDRLAFLFEPSGVRLHWITDRKFERFLRDPGNMMDPVPELLAKAPLPLKQNAWNQVRIDITGNTVGLSLNGQLVLQRTLEDSNRRTFGLFHFADRTEALVRNVTWRGDWPKKVPVVGQQELASRSLDFLDESALKLKAEYHHDFRTDALRDHFDLVGNDTAVEQDARGLLTGSMDGNGLKELRSFTRIHGDFDLLVGFRDLEILMPIPRWSAGIGVRVLLDSDADDTVGFYRTLARNKDNRRTSFYRSFRVPDGSLRYPGSFAVEQSRSGRFRLARRGSTFYALYSADDSENFRLIGQFETTNDPIAVQGLRLVLKGDRSVTVRAIWEYLHIRAEGLSGLTLSSDDAERRLLEIDERRDALPARTIDFSRNDSVMSELRTLGASDATTSSVEGGMRVSVAGGERQVAYVLANNELFNAGVDVEATMDLHQLGIDDSTETSCEFALKVFFDSSIRNSHNPVEATFILRQHAGGQRDLVTRIVHRNAANQLAYLPLRTLRVNSPDSFRAVVKGGLLYFLYSERDSPQDVVAAVSPITDSLTANGMHLKFVASGEGHSTDVTLKKLTFHQLETAVSE